jgi:hypothetical protein
MGPNAPEQLQSKPILIGVPFGAELDPAEGDEPPDEELLQAAAASATAMSPAISHL